MEKAIVAFLDVLGYSALVKRHIRSEHLIRNLEEILHGASVGLKERIKKGINSESLGDPEIDKYTDQMLDAVSVRFISDSIVYTLSLSKITFSHPNFTETETISNSIYLYLSLIVCFCTMFIGKTAHVLRGGIAIGRHYESNFDGQGSNLFVFSEALVKAYELENKVANVARILVDDSFWDYLVSLPFDYLDTFFYRDEDGKRCLDLYGRWQDYKVSGRMLEDIRDGITAHIRAQADNPAALSRLLYFADYHNRRISEVGAEQAALYIDIGIRKVGPKQ